MNVELYSYKGKNVTIPFISKIAKTCRVLEQEIGIEFKNVLPLFYGSDTYRFMKNTDNGLWLEPAGYIANEYLNEIKNNSNNSLKERANQSRILVDHNEARETEHVALPEGIHGESKSYIEGFNKGVEDGKELGLEALVTSLKVIYNDVNKVQAAITKNVEYKYVTIEDIKKHW